jgi:adenine C2-methylase RlmN of 23S rRNA A2503 and tRNA A37
MKKKIDIRQLSLEQLTDEIVKLGEKPYRAKQVHQ